jgi:cellulose biosynthesis protein BcsQ
MRQHKGKLITVWVPGNHGAGGSTVANSIGITLEHLTGKETLIVNLGSPKNYLQQYLKNDVELLFSMDHLRSFDRGMRPALIKTYASSINHKLFILPNSKISMEISRTAPDFNVRLLEQAAEVFSYVIVDIEAGFGQENKKLLDRSDIVVPVMNGNEMQLLDLFEMNPQLKAYVDADKSIPLFNGIHETQELIKALKSLNKKLCIKESYGISYDIDAHQAACCEGKLYSYLKSELIKGKGQLAAQLKDICGCIAGRLQEPREDASEKPSLSKLLLHRLKQWGEIDA